MNKHFLPVLTGIVLIIIFLAFSWLPLQPFGSYNIQVFSVFLVFIIIFSIPVILISLVLCFPNSTRSKALRVFYYSVCIFVGSFIGLRLGGEIRQHEFSRLADRSEGLITAIHSFVEKNQRPPQNFEELIPDYLAENPTTGMGAYPEYELIIPIDKELYGGNDWVLIVHCPLGMLNWDEFIYYPNGKYLKYDPGGYFQPIKNWAYYHE